MSGRAIPGLILIAAVAGCGGGVTTSHSSVSTTVGNRTVKADVDGTASITGEGDMATIRAGQRSIIVERTRVLVDGTPRATVPADAKEVHIRVADGETTITVDGKPAASP